jgi:transcriptional regulator with XRE-family HTH domain
LPTVCRQKEGRPWLGVVARVIAFGMPSFVDFLKKEFKNRKGKNPRYSLRSFAQHLGVDASTLSKMMSGRRPIGPIVMKNLSQRLGLSTEELQLFDSDSSEYLFQKMDLKSFEAISQWYHHAILELMMVRDFDPSPAWISRKLGVAVPEVRRAIKALQELKLIEIQKDGSWRDLSQGATSNIHPGLTSLAARQLQKEFLEKAQNSLDQDALSLRDHSSLTFAINETQIGDLKKLIKKFRSDVARLVDSAGKKDAVHNLTIALFPLTKSNNQPAGWSPQTADLTKESL